MKKIIIMSMSILFLSKCVDPINLINDENAKTVLVIDAKMIKYKETGRILVDLIQSSFNTDRSFAFIADEVSVINSAGNKLVLNRYAIGRYSANETASFKFTYGQKYKIRVFNNNGDTYESSFEELYPSPSIQKTSFKYEPVVKEGLSLSVNTTLNNENKNKILKWDLFQVFKMTEQKFGGPNLRTCYFSNTLNKTKVSLIDANNLEVNKALDLTVVKDIVDHEYSEGSYITIVQQAIDKKAQSYFIAYNNLVQREGNIFETPPGALPTNFKCVSDTTKLVTGYFFATQQDTARIFLSPDQLGNPSRLCPIPPNEASDCPAVQCCNCLLFKNASLVRPSYWR